MNELLNRRSMLECVGILGVAATAHGGQGGGGQQGGAGVRKLVKWAQPEGLETSTLPAGWVAKPLPGSQPTSANAVTILPGSGFVRTLGPEDKGKRVATSAATLQATLELPERDKGDFRGYWQALRGFLSKSPGARVTILADMGGKTHFVEFPYGSSLGKGGGKGKTKDDSVDFTRNFFSLDETEPRELTAKATYTATLVLTIQRKTEADSAFVSLDSLDLEAIFAAADEVPTPT